MKISFLGTNGWFNSPLGWTVCTMIEGEDEVVLLDAGTGLHRLAGKKLEKPATLLVSHLHLDHTGGLHALRAINFSKLNIVAGKNASLLKTFSSPPLMAGPNEQVSTRDASTSFPKQAFELNHVIPNYGWRFELDGKKIAYTGDTGECSNLDRLASGVDVLISECSMLPGGDGEWFHLNPEQAAGVAERNGVERLFLTHFSASDYTRLAQRANAEKVAKKIFPKTAAAKEELVVEL